jgi:hypothetical protein
VELVGEQPDYRELTVVVEFSMQQKILFAVIVLVVLAMLGVLIYWLLTRPLAPVVVVGEMEVRYDGELVKTISLSNFESKLLTIGKGCDIDLNRDTDILGPVARLVGRMGEDRRTQVPPLLQSLNAKGGRGDEVIIKINFNPLTRSEAVGRRRQCRQLDDRPNGVTINIGEHYELLYRYSRVETRKAHNA